MPVPRFLTFTAGLPPAGPIVVPGPSGALLDRPDQLDRRLEQVHVIPLLLRVEVIHRPDSGRGLEAILADKLADRNPILLLDRGVVVLLIGPAAGAAPSK